MNDFSISWGDERANIYPNSLEDVPGPIYTEKVQKIVQSIKGFAQDQLSSELLRLCKSTLNPSKNVSKWFSLTPIPLGVELGKDANARCDSDHSFSFRGIHLADERSRITFDSSLPNLSRRLEILHSTMLSGTHSGLAAFTFLRSGEVRGVKLLDLNEVRNFADLNVLARTSLQNQFTSSPDRENANAYFHQNFEQISAKLGDDLLKRYKGDVKMLGETNAFLAFRQTNEDIVCTDIHASIAAFRQAVAGQEAYIVNTTANDSAHVFTVFKNPATDSWNIQNYGTVIQTDAQDLRQLYEKFLPEQKKIRLYSVDSEGNITQRRNVLTSSGLRDWKFRNLPGAGGFDPRADRYLLNVGSDGFGLNIGNMNYHSDWRRNQFALNYYKNKMNEKGDSVVQGAAIEIQNLMTPGNFSIHRCDMKIDKAILYSEQKSTSASSKKTQYFCLFAGAEQESGQPIYWWNTPSDGSTQVGSGNLAMRLGATFANEQQFLYGLPEVPMKFEISHHETLGATLSLNASARGRDVVATYATRMWNDLVAEGSFCVGLKYRVSGLNFRTGFSPKIDFAKIDGFSDAKRQLGNTFDMSAYTEFSYHFFDKLGLGLMFKREILQSMQSASGFVCYQFNSNFSAIAMMAADFDPILSNRIGAKLLLNYKPSDELVISGNIGLGIDRNPLIGIQLVLKPKQ